MTRCTNRRTAILTLILGLTLLLCGCQVGGGVFVLPDISTNDSTQGKTQLLAALNKHYYTHFDNSDSSHFIYGNDSAAEAVLAYLQKVCADDASKVASLLSDSTGDTSPVHCADGLLASYPSLSASRARSATPRWTPAYRMMPFSHPLPRRCSKTAGFSSCRLTFHPAPIAVRSVLPSAPSADRPS